MTSSANSSWLTSQAASFVCSSTLIKICSQFSSSHLVYQPVHASGRYFRNTLVGILENDFGYEKAYSALMHYNRNTQPNSPIAAVNRLDRLTSGLMIIPLHVDRARELTSEFMAGTVRKEYVARCKGEFPA
jgi:tRNA pseudouridine synthase 9